MRQHDENGRQVAAYLAKHPKVSYVLYPGLESHPQHELAKRQMSGFGSMIAFEVGSRANADKLLQSVRVITNGESLGGVESLISHSATTTHAAVPFEERQRIGITEGLVRISVGIEDIADILGRSGPGPQSNMKTLVLLLLLSTILSSHAQTVSAWKAVPALKGHGFDSLRENLGFVSGHDLGRAVTAAKTIRASAPAAVLKGHGFEPCHQLCALTTALAAEGRFSQSSPPPPTAATAYRYFRVGSPTNLRVHPHAGYALMGGGKDLDEAFRWLCDHADDGDFLVLRATGTDAYNPYIQGPLPSQLRRHPHHSRSRRSRRPICRRDHHKCRRHLHFGRRSGPNYIRNFWAGTPVETALRNAVTRGIPIGGTSAGLAVLGQYIYSAQNDPPDGPDLTSGAALADPFTDQVVIAPDLLGIPILHGIITDSHFDTRHREGRLLVFMARILQSGQARTIRAIGVNEQTALLVDATGKGRVVGKGGVSLCTARKKPKVCEAGKPLTFGPVPEFKALAGESVDVRGWDGQNPSATVWVRAGQVTMTISVD